MISDERIAKIWQVTSPEDLSKTSPYVINSWFNELLSERKQLVAIAEAADYHIIGHDDNCPARLAKTKCSCGLLNYVQARKTWKESK